MVIFKGVNFYPRQVETPRCCGTPGLGPEYQIVLDSDGGGDRMTIVVEAEPGCDPAVARAHPAASCTTGSRCAPRSASAPPARSSAPPGKAVRVVDRRARV